MRYLARVGAIILLISISPARGNPACQACIEARGCEQTGVECAASCDASFEDVDDRKGQCFLACERALRACVNENENVCRVPCRAEDIAPE